MTFFIPAKAKLQTTAGFLRRAVGLSAALLVSMLFSLPLVARDDNHRLLVMLPATVPHYHHGVPLSSNYNSPSFRAQSRRRAEAIAEDYGLTVVDAWPMPVLAIDCYLMENRAQQTDDVLAELDRDQRIESVSRMQHFRTFAGDEQLAPPSVAIDRQRVRQLGTGYGIRIAQIDTGVDLKHADLRGQFELNRNFVDDADLPSERHGTAVAGVIAAKAGNSKGNAGLASDAKLLALRACAEHTKAYGECTSFALAKALHFAIEQGVDVINMSLGGPEDALLARLIDAAALRGIVVVAAHHGSTVETAFPASHAQVLAVAGSTQRDLPADLIIAPGSDVMTTLPGGRWGFISGASIAAAHVSGLSAVLMERGKRATSNNITALLSTPGAAASELEVSSTCSADQSAGPCGYSHP